MTPDTEKRLAEIRAALEAGQRSYRRIHAPTVPFKDFETPYDVPLSNLDQLKAHIATLEADQTESLDTSEKGSHEP